MRARSFSVIRGPFPEQLVERGEIGKVRGPNQSSRKLSKFSMRVRNSASAGALP